MLRRSAQALLPRLWQAEGASAVAPLSVALHQLPGSGLQSQALPAATRAYATPDTTLPDLMRSAQAVGMTPTTYAARNPTPAIRYDEISHTQFAPGGDESKRAFTYFVLTSGRFIGAAAVRLAVLKFVLSMTATKDVLAMANLEVGVGNIQPGNEITVKWRGKPVFVRHRSAEDIQRAQEVDISTLRDPQPDEARTKNPEWLILVGVCTHLGCVPLPNAGDYNGWFCPCHGSHYDTSGRIRRGPAPYNLEVPAYTFLDDTHVLIGA